MPIKPKNYPVILKPIINLYGMGLNTKLLKNVQDFDNNWQSNNFWMKFLRGKHLSWDLVILNGNIQFHTCFIGFKDKNIIGKFDYWESINKKLPKIIKKFIKEKLDNYTGCLNIETINNNMIEVHLRMGDLQRFPSTKLFEGIVKTYQKKSFDWKTIKLDKIFFYPIWCRNSISEKIRYKIFNYLKENIPRLLKYDPLIINYRIDHPSLASPNGDNRLMWIICKDQTYAKKIRNNIYQNIDIYKNKLN